MFIGPKQIKETKDGGKTLNGIEVIEIFYEDNTKEILSKLMYDKIVSEESCDLTQLRDKRLEPLVKETLTVLRNWGIKGVKNAPNPLPVSWKSLKEVRCSVKLK